jgi:hypothetical protein
MLMLMKTSKVIKSGGSVTAGAGHISNQSAVRKTGQDDTTEEHYPGCARYAMRGNLFAGPRNPGQCRRTRLAQHHQTNGTWYFGIYVPQPLEPLSKTANTAASRVSFLQTLSPSVPTFSLAPAEAKHMLRIRMNERGTRESVTGDS